MIHYGFFNSPAPTSLSDLVNDNNYMVIREYTLDPAALKSGSIIPINGIKADSTITKVSLNVTSPIKSSTTNPQISVITDSGMTLMDDDWNDPTIADNYSTDCYYLSSGNMDEIVVSHNISNPTEGLITLRIEMYESIHSYEELLTSDSKTFNTADHNSVEVLEQ